MNRDELIEIGRQVMNEAIAQNWCFDSVALVVDAILAHLPADQGQADGFDAWLQLSEHKQPLGVSDDIWADQVRCLKEAYGAGQTIDREKLGDVITSLCKISTHQGHRDASLSMAISDLKDIRRHTAGQARVVVKPLEWDRIYAKLENGCYYQVIQSQTGKTWCVSFVYRDGSYTLGYRPTEEAAKAAAFTHHETAVRSMIGGA